MMRPCGPEPRNRERSMPASVASRRASGVTVMPPESRAGPKLRAGVRTSKNGSSLIGCCGAGADGAACADTGGGAAGDTGVFGVAGGAGLGALTMAPPAPPITPTTAPTGATSPSVTRISLKTPASVAGTSIDTLSVSISNRLSPGWTASPADLNHLVILPSATVSPSCGIRIFIAMFPAVGSRDPFASDFQRRIEPAKDQTVAGEFIAADQISGVARLDAVLTMMRHGSGPLVDGVGAEIGDVIG